MTKEKTKGIKHNIVTDIIGNILAVYVHAANIHDTKVGVFTFEKALFYYPSIIGVCADNDYRKHFKNNFEEFHNIRVDISEHLASTFKSYQNAGKLNALFHDLAVIECFCKVSKPFFTDISSKN